MKDFQNELQKLELDNYQINELILMNSLNKKSKEDSEESSSSSSSEESHSNRCGGGNRCGAAINNPPLFFPNSNEENTPIGIGQKVDVITLGVTPTSLGSHQVKLDSTVELFITQKPNTPQVGYEIFYRLKKNGTAIATLEINRTHSTLQFSTALVHTEVPNLTWNDLITGAATYTVEIEVSQTVNVQSVSAQTKSLNAIVF